MMLKDESASPLPTHGSGREGQTQSHHLGASNGQEPGLRKRLAHGYDVIMTHLNSSAWDNVTKLINPNQSSIDF